MPVSVTTSEKSEARISKFPPSLVSYGVAGETITQETQNPNSPNGGRFWISMIGDLDLFRI
jgi:hypothetical protein